MTAPTPEPQTKRFQKPTVEEVRAYCAEKGYTIDAEQFVNYYESNGWRVGRNPMKSWKAAVATWTRNGYNTGRSYQRRNAASDWASSPDNPMNEGMI